MEFLDTVKNRRSIRRFSDRPVAEETLDRILEAGLLAPTSMDRKPCQFYLVRDPDLLKKLSKAKRAGAGPLAKCTAAIVVTADSEKADTWIEDCSIAMSYMNLAAVDAGLGVCWIQFHLRLSLLGKDAEQNVLSDLGTKAPQRLVGALALGYPDEVKEPHSKNDADWNKVHRL